VRRQAITLASALAGIILAFVAGTAIASHFSGGSGNSTNQPRPGQFSGFGNHNFPGGGRGFFGGLGSGDMAVGTVTGISGDTITVSSFTGSTETITVNGSTTYRKMSFSNGGPTSSSASLGDIKTNTRIFAQGSKSGGTFVAKTITITTGRRPGSRYGGFGQGQPPFGSGNQGSSGSNSGGI